RNRSGYEAAERLRLPNGEGQVAGTEVSRDRRTTDPGRSEGHTRRRQAEIEIDRRQILEGYRPWIPLARVGRHQMEGLDVRREVGGEGGGVGPWAGGVVLSIRRSSLLNVRTPSATLPSSAISTPDIATVPPATLVWALSVKRPKPPSGSGFVPIHCSASRSE